MPMLMLEGFEIYAAGTQFTAQELNRYLSAREPDNTEGWFEEPDSIIEVVDTDYRIAGKSLHFHRSAGSEGSFDRTKAVNLGFPFVNKSSMFGGFGFKFSRKPSHAVPLIVFRYDAANGEEEQASVWASPNGKIFFSETNFQPNSSDQAVPLEIMDADTPSGTIRFGVWNYVEAGLYYPTVGSDLRPLLYLAVNGHLHLVAARDAAFQKASVGRLSTMNFICPPSSYFGDADFDMWMDDIYIGHGGTKSPGIPVGPQQVILLTIDSTLVSDWTGTPASGDFPNNLHAAVEPTSSTKRLKVSFSNLPVGVTQVTALEVLVAARMEELPVNLNVFISRTSLTSGSSSKDYTVSDDDARIYRHINEKVIDYYGLNGVNDITVTLKGGSVVY